ncbi:tripartite tricarboxylate transporter TctB family protein [Moraxella oculi]|uniref:Tripartite tricarboxylate transporter TctB family protein n=1 Tax=Moraxella oculi TaxID=2940516 RepID=A0ABW8U3K3_9GAMM
MNTKVERIFAFVLLGISVVMIIMAWGYTAPIAYDPIGPRPYPILLLSLMAIGSALLAFQPAKFMKQIDYGWNKPVVKNLILCMLALLLYGALFEILGYVISTSLMAFAVGLLFHGKAIPTAISSVMMALLTYLLFERVLDVSLPSGLLSVIGF